ncbi:NAD(P)/FAD-dependent oxidoreductase [Hyphobacterium sp.]|uniref:NAD(P)/FAD-dependent oxidoreductase n=1 Tax=Hyphobacterium sp. TaxID=2004662 RepID=UPI003BAD890B
MSFKLNPRMKVAIAGGGIAGLACAYVLLQRGAAVSLFEAGQVGRGALWASGGMLAGGFECAAHNAPPDLAELSRRSMSLWHQWAQELGPDRIGFRASGVLASALTSVEQGWLDGLAAYAKAHGFRTQSAKPETAGLNAETALIFNQDGELDNRRLGPVLADAVRQFGGQVYENTPVIGVDINGGVVVQHARGAFEADAVILATGHEAAQLAGFEPALSQLIPVKGQMLSVEATHLNLPACVRAIDVYLSQKPGGRVVIGATSETGVCDDQVDPAAIAALRDRANLLLPGLKEQTELERWCGIRPGTRDGLPIFGAGQTGGVFLATGLYRNGVLLAPAVAESMADMILTGASGMSALSPSRFEPH